MPLKQKLLKTLLQNSHTHIPKKNVAFFFCDSKKIQKIKSKDPFMASETNRAFFCVIYTKAINTFELENRTKNMAIFIICSVV